MNPEQHLRVRYNHATARQHMCELPEDGSVDAGLMLLLELSPRGVEWTQQEIADVCGCSRGYIWLLEQQAMKKIRRSYFRLRAQGKI